MSSGGLFGKGIGASQQKWGNLPEAHTDFIFAVLGEELGLVGTLLVLALFLTIAYAGIRVARAHHGPVRPLHVRRHHRLADRADDDQHRHGARAAARSSACRCRWCPTAAPRCCPRWWRSACWCRSPAPSRGPRPPCATARRRRVRGRGHRRSGTDEAHAMKVLLAGGGTAGHTSPLLATADALRRLDPTRRGHRARHPARARGPGRPGGAATRWS